jgi:beta-lactamase class A
MSNHSNEMLNKKIKKYKIFIILAIVLSLTSGLLISPFSYKKITINSKYNLIDPLREFLPSDFYIVNIQGLRSYLHSLEGKYPDNLSVYYENINTGANISVGKDLRLFPASLSKLVQAILIVRKVEDGELAWDQQLKPTDADISSESGGLYKTIGDNSISVEDLLKELLTDSDNTAQNMFRHHLDVTDYASFQQETGLEDLYNEKGYISAKEYARILRVLYTSSYLKPENSEKILTYMTQSKFKDYLSQGIPGDVKFAHKYGENKEQSIFADAGIVYVKNKPYMLTVIIKGKDSSLETRRWAVKLMKEISEQAYLSSR